jgi:thioesterase domain-containing protein
VAELVIVHPGGLSVTCWSRLAALLPAGTTVRVEELEMIHAFWSDAPDLTVESLASRVRPVSAEAVLVGWGVGGAVADALAARGRPRHVVVLDGQARGALEPDEGELLRRFAMYLGARCGMTIDPAAASARRGFEAHVRRERRDHRLVGSYVPSGAPLTVVRAARSLDGRPALGWDAFGPVEVLASGGDHYSMLTETSCVAGLAMALGRWLGIGGYGEQTVGPAVKSRSAARLNRPLGAT